MAYYAVGERRLKPGALAEYVEASRRIIEYWGRRAGEHSYRIYVGEKDPADLLALGSWPSRRDFEAAFAQLPPDLKGAPSKALVEGHNVWRWYRTVREVRSFLVRATHMTAVRMRVEPAQVGTFRDYARRNQDRVTAEPGIVATRLLESADEDGGFVGLIESRDPASADQLFHRLSQDEAPPGLVDWRIFAGRLDFEWDRFAQVEGGGTPQTR